MSELCFEQPMWDFPYEFGRCHVRASNLFSFSNHLAQVKSSDPDPPDLEAKVNRFLSRHAP